MRRLSRPLAALATLAAVAAAGLALDGLPPMPRDAPPDPRADPHGHVVATRSAEVSARFGQAVTMLHAKRYEHAVTALHRVLELAPRMPEAHANMGFALLGLGRPAAARDFFASAIDLRAGQANAYYGLGVALEALGDLPGATGAMRSYVHLAPADDPHLRRARAALWEWEARAGR